MFGKTADKSVRNFTIWLVDNRALIKKKLLHF